MIETNIIPLSKEASRFRSAIDDLAVFEPTEETRDIVRQIVRPLSDRETLVLQVLDPEYPLTCEYSKPECLLYSADVVGIDGSIIDSVWIDGLSVMTAGLHREPEEQTDPDRVIKGFMAKWGELIK